MGPARAPSPLSIDLTDRRRNDPTSLIPWRLRPTMCFFWILCTDWSRHRCPLPMVLLAHSKKGSMVDARPPVDDGVTAQRMERRENRD